MRAQRSGESAVLVITDVSSECVDGRGALIVFFLHVGMGLRPPSPRRPPRLRSERACTPGPMGSGIVEAHQAGVITTAEARHLAAFEKRPMKSRKRMLAEATDASDAAVAKMRGKLAEVSARFYAQHPELKDRRDAR